MPRVSLPNWLLFYFFLLGKVREDDSYCLRKRVTTAVKTAAIELICRTTFDPCYLPSRWSLFITYSFLAKLCENNTSLLSFFSFFFSCVLPCEESFSSRLEEEKVNRVKRRGEKENFFWLCILFLLFKCQTFSLKQ